MLIFICTKCKEEILFMNHIRTRWLILSLIVSTVFLLMICMSIDTRESVSSPNPTTCETWPQPSQAVTLEDRLQTALSYKPLKEISFPSKPERAESNEGDENSTEALEETADKVLTPTENMDADILESQPSKPQKENQATNLSSGATPDEASKWQGEVLNKRNGVVQGPSGKETYYNLPMGGVIRIMRKLGYDYEYWVRDDGVKMFGPYVMCAANLELRPKGTIVETSLGTAIVCDTGSFAKKNRTQLDIAVAW